MPRSRGSEMPQQQPQQQRQSPRAPLHLRTTNSDSIGVHTHHRSSPKLEDNHRRSPRSPLPELTSCNQKKRWSRVTDLETKLGHVQEELKKLREQLAAAEAAKRDAQHELEETKKLIPTTPTSAGDQPEEERHDTEEIRQVTQQKDDELSSEAKLAEESKIQVDYLEVVPPMDAVLEKEDGSNNDVVVVVEDNKGSEDDVDKVITGEESKEEAAAVIFESKEVVEPEEADEKAQVSELETKLQEMVRELELCLAENASLKKQLKEAEASAAAACTREEEAALKLTHAAEELAESKAKADQLGEQLEAAEGAKSSLEGEMNKLRIQTEQWRKAAEAAVAALSVTGGMGAEAGGRRVAERCGSMDKHLVGGGEFSQLGSPLMADDSDDGFVGGKRKGAGIRMFGDLWKKKSEQK